MSIPNYDAIAEFYRQHWCGHFHAGAVEMLDHLLLATLQPPASILDVCCGVGTIAQHLVSRGYKVTGIDASAEMLAKARIDVPQADFQLADVRGFRLSEQFAGALSTFDSLNHMLTIGDLQKTFDNVYAALLPGAAFVFDMSLEEAYRTDWKQTCNIIEEDDACIIRGNYDESRRIGTTQITRFYKEEGLWQRTDVEWQTRCFQPEQVTAALYAAGFGRVSCHSDVGLGPRQAAYFARKPADMKHTVKSSVFLPR